MIHPSTVRSDHAAPSAAFSLPTSSGGGHRNHGPSGGHHLLRLTTVLHPTADQEACLLGWWTRVAHAHWTVGQVLLPPGAAPSAPVEIPKLTRDETEAWFAIHCPDLREHLPPGVWRGVASQVYSRWRPLMDRTVPACRIAEVAGEAAGIPLDACIQAAGPMHVHVAGCGNLILADLWRLPLGLTEALLVSASNGRRALQATVQAARIADRAGDRSALATLHGLVCGHGPRIDLAEDGRQVVRHRPHRARHATLIRERQPDGQEAWAIEWSLRVPPGWLPQAVLHETAGVDVGIRALLTWTDGARHGQLLNTGLPTGDWRPRGMSSPLADAYVRRAQYERLADPLNDALICLLQYGRIAVEDTDWPGFRAGVREAMNLTGATSLLDWLTRLGRLSGTLVRPVAPEGTSRHCARCGCQGRLDGAVFHCPVCPPEDRDLNAAGYIRRRVLEGRR